VGVKHIFCRVCVVFVTAGFGPKIAHTWPVCTPWLGKH